MSVWKSDETLLSICILNFSFKNDFVWEEISNIRHSVSSPDETPRSSSKILRCTSYFQLSSRCFIWWWNTASHVWYITWRTANSKPPTIPFVIVACTFCDNLSRNSCILVERKYMPSTGHFLAVNSVTSFLCKENFLIFFQR